MALSQDAVLIAEHAPPAAGPEKSMPLALPSWLRVMAPIEAPRAGPLSPSAAFDEEIGRVARAQASPAERQKALQRGRIVHRLMQSLPDIPGRPQGRYRALSRRRAKDFSAAEQTEMTRQVFAILDEPDLRGLCSRESPGSADCRRIARAGAAPIESQVGGPPDRHGGHRADCRLQDDSAVPKPSRRGRALRRPARALPRCARTLYPGKTVRAALIFTNGPSLIHVPPRRWIKPWIKR